MTISLKKKVPDPEKIPPTRDVLRLHVMRCGYQIYQWKKALDNKHVPDDPDGFDWETTNDHQLDIKWMTKRPAPDEVLEFTICSCKKSNCMINQCQCYLLKLQCMDLCECRNCINVEQGGDEGDEDDENEDDDDNEDDSLYDSESSESDSDDNE